MVVIRIVKYLIRPAPLMPETWKEFSRHLFPVSPFALPLLLPTSFFKASIALS